MLLLPPLPHSKRETEGVFPLWHITTNPSLTQNVRWRGCFLFDTSPPTPPSLKTWDRGVSSVDALRPPSLPRHFWCYVPRGALTRLNGYGLTQVVNPWVRGGLTAGTGPGDAETPCGSPVEFPSSNNDPGLEVSWRQCLLLYVFHLF